MNISVIKGIKMRIIYDYYGLGKEGGGQFVKTYELSEDDRPYILEYLKENYPEWWYEPDKYPLPKEIDVYILNTLNEELEWFTINTKEWELGDRDES